MRKQKRLFSAKSQLIIDALRAGEPVTAADAAFLRNGDLTKALKTIDSMLFTASRAEIRSMQDQTEGVINLLSAHHFAQTANSGA